MRLLLDTASEATYSNLMAQIGQRLDEIGSLTAEGNDILAAHDTLAEALRRDALDINDLIAPTNLPETNLHLYYDIYLETVAKGIDTFSTTEAANLAVIANQCPLEGGIAAILV